MRNSPTTPPPASVGSTQPESSLKIPVPELYSWILDQTEILLSELNGPLNHVPAATLGYMVRTFSTYFGILCRSMNEPERDRLAQLMVEGLTERIEKNVDPSWVRLCTHYMERAIREQDVALVVEAISNDFPSRRTPTPNAMRYDYSEKTGAVLDQVDWGDTQTGA